MRAAWLSALFVTGVCATVPPGESPRGLWVHARQWEQVPPEAANDDGSIPQYAYAMVANFCPDGQLHIWSGVLYSTSLSEDAKPGVSDGITLYSGSWRDEGKQVLIEYRLRSAEIRRVPTGERPIDEHRTISTEVRLVGGRMEFPFESRFGDRANLTFIPASAFDRGLDADEPFIRCSPSQGTQ